MKKIILATSNLGKVRELNSMLEGHYNVVSQIDMKVEEVQKPVLVLLRMHSLKLETLLLKANFQH